MTSLKVYTRGTHRVRTPEDTWAIIEPLFERFGITRLADVTDLDVFGIPVVMAVRPSSRTLSVSQGKGQSLQLAKISAAMESIELWHAEYAPPPLLFADTSAAELDLPYSLAQLGALSSPLLDEHSRIDWVAARSIGSGAEVPVPFDMVVFREPSSSTWKPGWIRTNSNGLASGNSREEAILHALYEIVERDALSRPGAERIVGAPTIDPTTVDDEECRSMIEKILNADGSISMQMLPSVFGIPTFRCILFSWDFPLICSGFGCHIDPAVALSRAITEAAQGRLATISGSRDDLEHYYDQLSKPKLRAEYQASFRTPDTDFRDIASAHTLTFDNTTDELLWLNSQVREVLGTDTLVVDLSSHDSFAVVKVIMPGGELDVGRIHPRAERSA